MPNPDTSGHDFLPATSRWRAWAVTAIILTVYGLVVAGVGLQLREHWRQQVLDREGDVVQAVTTMERERIADAAEEDGVPPVNEPFGVVLQTSKSWHGVLAVRLFDIDGAFVDAVPLEVYEGAIPPEVLRELASGDPVARYHAAFPLADLFMSDSPDAVAPLLEVDVVLPAVEGAVDDTTIAQFWIDGTDLQAEFATLNRRVFEQTLAGFGAGALLIAGSLWWGFRRVERANRLLRARALDLAQANRELAQSARTSAIGAIAAHLMHGLRNPLSGLESFVATQGGEGVDGEEWASALESTRRLRSFVNEVQAVLRDVQTGTDFEVTSNEVCAGLCERLQKVATKRNVRIEVAKFADAMLDAKTAGLGGLVLANLVQNAIEASRERASIKVTVSHEEGCADFVVSDSGSGLSADVASDPFRPRRSTKPDGAGIGLAISWQLARHAGGELSLVRTGSDGTAFRLRLPSVTSQAAPEAR